MAETMQAVVNHGSYDSRLEEVPNPSLSHDEVRRSSGRRASRAGGAGELRVQQAAVRPERLTAAR